MLKVHSRGLQDMRSLENSSMLLMLQRDWSEESPRVGKQKQEDCSRLETGESPVKKQPLFSHAGGEDSQARPSLTWRPPAQG